MSGKMEGQNGTVVLLHGFMGSAADWHSVARRLENGVRVVALNLPGHGATPLPADEFTMEDVVSWLNEALDEYELGRVILVGYSMGGRIALNFAVTHPDRCSRLVTVSASPGIRGAAERSARVRADEEWADRLMRLPREEFLQTWYAQPVFSALRARPALLKAVIASKSGFDPDAAAIVLRCLSAGRQPSLWSRLETLPMPTLAMAGALDGRYVETAQEMAVLAPNISAGIVPDAGHVVHLEQETAFLQLVGGFIGYLPPA